MTPRILVLGASGFIGERVAAGLAATGHRVTAAVRRPTTFSDARILQYQAEFHAPDDFRDCLADIDIVVHAATASTPGSTMRTPLAELDTNLQTTLSLLTALQDHTRVRLVYLSSGGTLYGDAGESLKAETDRIRPRSYHGAAKAAAEHFIGAWSDQYGGSAVIVRPSNVYGPGQPSKPGFGIVPMSFHCAMTGTPMTIWGDGSSRRDYIYIDDMVDFVQRAIVATPLPGVQTFNVSSGHAESVSEIIAGVSDIVGQPVTTVHMPPRPGDVHTIQLDNRAARAAMQWEPVTSIQQGLKATWDWTRASG